MQIDQEQVQPPIEVSEPPAAPVNPVQTSSQPQQETEVVPPPEEPKAAEEEIKVSEQNQEMENKQNESPTRIPVENQQPQQQAVLSQNNPEIEQKPSVENQDQKMEETTIQQPTQEIEQVQKSETIAASQNNVESSADVQQNIIQPNNEKTNLNTNLQNQPSQVNANLQQQLLNDAKSDNSSGSGDFDSSPAKNGGHVDEPGQLYTITLDTYKASRLNSILSQFNVRIDPFEQVQTESRRRDVQIKARNKQLVKQMRIDAKNKEREEKRNAAIRQRQTQMYNNQQFNRMTSMSSNMMQSYPMSSINNIDKFMSTAHQPIQPVSEVRNQDGDAVGGKVTGTHGQIIGNESSLQENNDAAGGDIAGAEGSKDEMNNQSDAKQLPNENSAIFPQPVPQTNGLYPTPQKSMEQQSLGEDSLNPQFQKNNKKLTIQQTKMQMQDLFDRLKMHPNAAIFNQPIDPTHALYEELKNNYETLMMLDIQLKNNQYQNTNILAQQFRNMIHCKLKYCSVSGTTELQNQIQNFYDTFEQGFRGLDGLPLTKANEAIPKPKVTDKKPQFNKQKSIQQSVDNKSKQPQPQKKPTITPGGPQMMQQINLSNLQGQKQIGLEDGLSVQPQVPVGPVDPVVIWSDPKYRKMTQEETSKLKTNIDTLSIEQKKGIVPIVEEFIRNNNNGDARFEFELDKLAPEVARKLEQYVNESVAQNIRKQKRKEADKKRRDNKRMEQEQQKQQKALVQARQQAVHMPQNMPLQAQKSMQNQQIAQSQVSMNAQQQAVVNAGNPAAQMAGNQQVQMQMYQQMLMQQMMAQGQNMLPGGQPNPQQLAAMQTMMQNNATKMNQFNLQQQQAQANMAAQQQQQLAQQQHMNQQLQNKKNAGNDDSSSSSSDTD